MKRSLSIVLACLAAGTALAAPPDQGGLDDARVTLPWKELEALLEKAAPRPVPPPPVPYSILAARYEIELRAEVVLGSVEYEIQSYADGWQVVPLLGEEAQLERIEPPDARIVLRDGRYAFQTDAAGVTSLRLFFAAPATAAGAQLRIPRALSGTITVAETAGDRRVGVPGAVPTGEPGTYRLPGTDHLEIQSVAVETLAPPIPSVWEAASRSVITVDDESLRYETRLQARAAGGSALSMNLLVPAAARELTIESEDLSSWEQLPDQSIRVVWNTRDRMARELRLAFRIPLPQIPGQLALDTVRLAEGNTEPALLAILPAPGLELIPQAPAPPERLPPWLREATGGQAPVLAMAQTPLDARWLPLVEPAPAVIDKAHGTLRVVQDGALLTEVVYVLKHDAPISWPLDLPDDSQLLSCSVNGKPIAPVDRGGGRIELQLSGGRGQSEVRCVYTGRTEPFAPVAGALKLTLPLTALLIHALDWEIRIPADYQLEALEGNVSAAAAGSASDAGSTVIRVRKELCRAERPAVQIFYRKPAR